MKVTRPTVDKNKEGNQCICNQTRNNCSQQCTKIINKYFFILKKAMMLKVCNIYKHINKDPVDKVAQFRGANSQNYWQKTTLQKFLLFCFTLALLGCEIPFKLHTANCNDLVTAQFLIYYAFQPLQKSTFLLLERKTEKKTTFRSHIHFCHCHAGNACVWFTFFMQTYPIWKFQQLFGVPQ